MTDESKPHDFSPDELRPENERAEDGRMAELLARLADNAPPADERLLAELRGRSLAAFAEGGDLATPRTNKTQAEKHTMSVFFARIGLAAAAAVVAMAAWFAGGTAADDDVKFGSVLDRVALADSVQFDVVRDGKNERVLMKSADGQPRLRLDRADGTYTIAAGDHQWEINEAANEAKVTKAAYFSDVNGKPAVDVLRVLNLPSSVNRQQLAAATPVDEVERSGVRLAVYRWDVPAATGTVPYRIEAYVNDQTRMLTSLICEETGREPRPITSIHVAFNKPIDDSMFVVGDTLTDDGRIGKVADVQGIVSLKPAMHERWTPVVTHALLRLGDWVRTDVRGANAVALRLVNESLVTLGPGSLVEIQKPNRLRLSSGEIKIVAAEGAPVELLGIGDDKLSVTGTAIYRLQIEKLVRLEKPPLWLAGFEGTTNNESIGSLVAKVDGRDVPLTVGYHKVTVDIRDQIARTVVEESFVNHTAGRLEGVFYFPLPEDASISGFGMWIGNELVEADVVEKQRAREIYETILRERRDPGLLEWTGGNIFKARVFPIEAHSEKRIKISYTQVLPLRGKSYRYSYGLRSELLKQHPLRELAIDVRLNSTQALASVQSPTHTTSRVDNTVHSAHVEFTAEEYTPERDFEVVAQLADNQPNVVLIPHRRGDDGYFMLMLTPPANGNAAASQTAAQGGDANQWRRDVLPNGKPLNLLILADTSASMDAASRQSQAEFIASLVSSLGANDRFNLATCDVETNWAFPSPVAADDMHVEAARKQLADRSSLGWTDLEMAFASAIEQADDARKAGNGEPQVIYVGDGITTAFGADPAAFVKRLEQLCRGKSVSLHAVSVSNSFEPMVMKAIASQGGGSVRQVAGDLAPQAVALELLSEISRPALRDLRIEFSGIRTARVYPSELPNLPVGSQQIVLGRYLPAPGEQHGEVIVTGLYGDEPVRFRTPVTLPPVDEAADAKEDVSFIPRLWARMHLDALLAQGTSQAVQDEIINLSEQYHIITPYTSLLVLESDADRERFGVKRRFQMRDAERFFAEGRDNANFELLAQQMKRAGTWRQGLRQQVLAQLIGLGRDAQVFDVSPRPIAFGRAFGSSGSVGGRAGFGGGGFQRSEGRRNSEYSEYLDVSGPLGGPESGQIELNYGSMNGNKLKSEEVFAENGRLDMLGKSDSFAASSWIDNSDSDDFAFKALGADKPIAAGAPFQLADELGDQFSVFADGRDRLLSLSSPVANEPVSLDFKARLPIAFDSEWAGDISTLSAARPGGFGDRRGQAYFNRGQAAYYDPTVYTRWLDVVFPPLADAPAEEPPFEPQKPWPADVRAIVEGLLRTDQLHALAGGLTIERHSDSYDPRFNELTGRSDTLEMVSPSAWLTRGGGFGSQTIVNWCDKDERGIYGEAYWLGRRRKASPRELAQPPLGLAGQVLRNLERSYTDYTAKLEPQGENQTRLILTNENNPGYEMRYLIDTVRKVVLSIEIRQDGELTSRTAYDDFVDVAGAWYAGRTQTFDKDGGRTALTTDKFTLLAAADFTQRMSQQLASRDRVQFLKLPLPTVVEAKRDLEANKATFEDHIVLLLLDGMRQQWDSAFEHVAELERLAGDKAGMKWVRDAILNDSRRQEELRRRVVAFATELAKPQSPQFAESEALFLANICTQDVGTFEANELLALLDTLKPVYERQPAYTNAMKGWLQNRANQLRKASRAPECWPWIRNSPKSGRTIRRCNSSTRTTWPTRANGTPPTPGSTASSRQPPSGAATKTTNCVRRTSICSTARAGRPTWPRI